MSQILALKILDFYYYFYVKREVNRPTGFCEEKMILCYFVILVSTIELCTVTTEIKKIKLVTS